MMKKSRIMLALLCALCLLAAAAEGSEGSLRNIRTTIGRVEQGCIAMMGDYWLIPEDFSGFELQVRPDLPEGYPDQFIPGLPAPETDESSGMFRFALAEETARQLLESAYAASISPDGAILWFIYDSPPFMVVQRGKTLVLAAQSSGRGAADTDGGLKSVLDYKLSITTDPAESRAAWSPDGRYLFFNEPELWRNDRMMLNDPYLLDSYTGDIFLIESSGNPKNPLQDTFRCVLNGCFSADGKSFYWYCRSYAPGDRPGHFLMRYDLESGARETVCELKGAMLDFSEIRENCWFLLEASGGAAGLVRLTLSPDGIERTEEPLPAFCNSAGFLPAVRGNVLLAATPLSSSGTYLLPLTWDAPAGDTWYKVGSLREDALQEISTDAIEAELREAKNNPNAVSGRHNIGTAYIKDADAIIGVTNLLLTVSLRDPIPESWGGGYEDFNGQVILNTENLKQFPIWTGWIREGTPDTLINGDCFLAMNYGQDAVGLYSAYELPEVPFLKGETYRSQYGTFLCRNESDPLVLTSVTLKNRECSAEITIAGDSYTVRFRVADRPEPEAVREEYTVPEVLTVERWNEITSAMDKKDKKKFSSLYGKITPDKLAARKNSDEILACYPAAATETLYILQDDLKTSSLSMAETILEAIGYTAEDYRRDMEQVAVPRETNVIVTKNGSTETSPVRYTFIVPDPLLYPGSARVQELAGLCEQIGRAVTANRLSAEPLPVESVILDRYYMGNIDFDVTVNNMEETETTLEFTLTVTY